MSCGCSACAAQSDPLKLVRSGTDQVQRSGAAPDATSLRIDERRPEHAMVFASAYARHLSYVDPDGDQDGTWESFFTTDTSAQLAVAATEDVAVYRTTVQGLLRRLENPELPASGSDTTAALGAVFDVVGTMALRLDTLKQGLPQDEPLRATLDNLVRSRLSPVLRRLIGFYLAGAALGVVDRTASPADASLILGRGIESFDSLLTGSGLSPDWPQGVGVGGWGPTCPWTFPSPPPPTEPSRPTWLGSTTSPPTTSSPPPARPSSRVRPRRRGRRRGPAGQLPAQRAPTALRAFPLLPAAVRLRP